MRKILLIGSSGFLGKNVFDKINDMKYQPYIDKIYSFKDIGNAHMRMENREHFGKIIIVP